MGQVMQPLMENVDLTAIEQRWREIKQTYGSFLPQQFEMDTDNLNIADFFSLEKWIDAIQAYILFEVTEHIRLLSIIFLLSVLASVLKTMGHAFGHQTVSKTAEAAILIPVFILAMNTFRLAVESASGAIENMTVFMTAFMPVLIALLTLSGAVASAALFPPLLLFLMNASGILIDQIVLPSLIFSVLFSLVGLLSDHYKADRIAGLLRTLSVSLLSAFMAVFLAVITMRGMAAATADGLTVKTAKFLSGTFVPVVGRMMADAADTASGAALMINNTAGAAGIGLLLLTAMFPVVKIMVLVFLYKVAAAVLQPLGDSAAASCLEIIGKTMSFVLAALALVSFMYFLMMAAVVAAGNAAYMMR
ncbi:stage III sporulation protein AE [Domibacillus epiphyticus]|uniref:Stage III sporulation protein AE n=1 Tax=Domibacillus epiphyticus TaxID=1714355 RepID=A0A1V2A9M7_9BACI|nr:stage III sporulation protein AE [Domibacillus epiphyticus]OMP67705.1 stage III sporulation protein AE [Domibacillus epiphyticus]